MKRTLAIFLSIMMMLPLCFAFGVSAATSTAIYIDDINSYASNGELYGPILLYGANKTAADFGVSAHGWWHKAVLTFNSADGSFVVKQTCFYGSSGDTSYTGVTLGTNEVMILTHSSYADFNNAIAALTVGDKLYAYGFDFTNATATNKLSGSTSDVCFTTYEPTLGNGYYGYVEPTEPEEPEVDSNVASLGAKVNTELYGLRMGATLTRDNSRGEVIGLGMLVISENVLGSDELNLEYAASNSSVVDVKARSIDNYVQGQDFEDYETVTYYVTILGLEDYTSENIVACPYVTYRSGSDVVTYYGEAMVRNYSDVAADALGE